MKTNGWEKFKDKLYDYLDYVVVILIILLVGTVIKWRLDNLFLSENLSNTNESSINSSKKDSEINAEDNKKNNQKNTSKEEKNEETNNTEQNEIKTINIEIPEGAPSNEIGNILEDNNLIESSNDFVEKAAEMNLETKLKPGQYEFSNNMKLEEIIELIAK